MGYTGEGGNITLSSEEEARLCRLPNGEPSDDENVEDTEDAEDVFHTAAEPIKDEKEISLPRLSGGSLTGRQTPHFLLR